MKNLFALLFSLSCAFAGYSQEWNFSYRQGKLDTNISTILITGSFGSSMAKYGNQILIGDPWEHFDLIGQNYLYKSGAVYVMTENPLYGWQQIEKITAPTRQSYQHFGEKIAILDSFLFVSCKQDSWDENDSNFIANSGSVFVYKHSQIGNTWNFWQKLVAPDRMLQPLSASSEFGYSICTNNSSLFVSAPKNYLDEYSANPLEHAGKVFEFRLNGLGYWQISGQITANFRNQSDYFGESLTSNDSLLAISSIYNDYDANEQNFVQNSGAVYIYKQDSNQNWQFSYKLTDSIRFSDDVFGQNLKFIDDKLLVIKSAGPSFKLITFLDSTSNGDFGILQRISMSSGPYAEIHNGFNQVFIGSKYSELVKCFEWSYDTLVETQIITHCIDDTSRLGHSFLNWNTKLLIGAPWDDAFGAPQGAFLEFEFCTAPVLNGLTADTITDCTGLAAISVDSNSSIGSGVAWGLYFGTTTDSLLATDSTGNFNIQLTEPGYYSISAIGSCNAMCKQIESFYFQFDTLYSSVQIVACDSEYVLNQWVTTSTTLYDTLSSVNGCDSIAVFDVTILNPTVTNEDVFGCDSLFFDGLWFNSNSTHSSTFVGMNGCDSVVNYSIYLQNTQHFFDTVYGFDSALVYGQWVYTYGWYDTVFTSAFGCDSIYHYWVELGANFGLLFNTTNEVFGADGMIDLMVIGGVGPYTYDWDNDGLGDADDTQDLSGLTAGTYSVIVVDKYGKVTSGSVDVESSLSISELSTNTVSVYPNPTTGMLNIKSLESQIKEIQLFNVLGEVLISKRLQNAENTELDLSGFSNGIYFLEIKNANNETFTQRIIKE